MVIIMNKSKADKKTAAALSVTVAVIVAALLLLIPLERKRQLYEKWGELAVLAETDGRAQYIIDHEELYPENVLSFFYSNSNNDNLEFVYNYPFHKNDYQNMSYTAEELDGRVPALYMFDPRWSYQQLDGEFFIKSNGCALVSLTMAYIRLTGKSDLDPYKIMLTADEMGAIGMFGGITDEYTKALCEKIGLTVTEYRFFNDGREKDKHADIELMKSILDSGHLIMAGMVGETFGVHALIIAGYNDEGFIVNDPASREKSAKIWTYDDIEPEIYFMWDLSA